jgi:4-hydroxy-2-oxoheptanedioate aldolase
MAAPKNEFKRMIGDGATQYGIFSSLADSVSSEIAARSGLDFICIDTEHAPNGLRSLLQQVQSTEHGSAQVMVRPYVGEKSLIKRILDLGAQTLLIPMVEDAQQARDLVAATRYPPEGVRGVAGARATNWGRTKDYFTTANDQICLIVQVETQNAVSNIAEIAGVDGVDGVFVGPSDLAADMGLIGQASHPDVQAVVSAGLQAIASAGKPAGVFAPTPETAQAYIEAGATFLLVGVDTYLLAGALTQLVTNFKG